MSALPPGARALVAPPAPPIAAGEHLGPRLLPPPGEGCVRVGHRRPAPLRDGQAAAAQGRSKRLPPGQPSTYLGVLPTRYPSRDRVDSKVATSWASTNERMSDGRRWSVVGSSPGQIPPPSAAKRRRQAATRGGAGGPAATRCCTP
eukprot:scaffold1165_cov323-Prasinococcus_capsulatus_cf.AAC.1